MVGAVLLSHCISVRPLSFHLCQRRELMWRTNGIASMAPCRFVVIDQGKMGQTYS